MLDYVILGVIQGIFEWIPISSQGVVAIVSQFLIKEVHPLEIALFLHLGTFFAVLVYFRKNWFEILKLKDPALLRFLLISTIVSGVVGFSLYNNLVKSITMGNSLLVVTGFGLLLTAYCHTRAAAKGEKEGLSSLTKAKKISGINFNKLAVIAGILQGLAVIPGLSRSGATIFGLSLGKLNPSEILKISYMMSAPAVLAMSGFLFIKNPVLISEGWPALVFSFLAGFLALGFLLKIAAKIDFFKFALIFAFFCFLGAGLELLV
ncbi:MAG: undecaprenyl-diphosphate phosphatase [bacterium]|nr:undecaprenyl-diphosphate phosphatase [bacterium]